MTAKCVDAASRPASGIVRPPLSPSYSISN